MDVILDSNILVADPWLRSHRVRSLVEYLAKTRANLVLLDPVEQEVGAHMHRALAGAVGGIETALRTAERLGVFGLPTFDAGAAKAASNAAWEAAFVRGLRPATVERVPLQVSILPEVVRRAAHRLPPVRSNGRETRDTIIWLALVHYLRERQSANPTAFISANTEDFAAPDGKSLRPELLPDLEGIKGTFEYYPSVEAFLRAYAEPISHITDDWVKARLDMAAVTRLIVERLRRTVAPERDFRISSSEYRDDYEPLSVETVFDPDVTLDDIYVWEVEPEVVDVFLDFGVEVEADVDCRLVRPPHFGHGVDEDEFSWRRTLTCDAELSVSIGAQIRGDTLTLGEIEDIARL